MAEGCFLAALIFAVCARKSRPLWTYLSALSATLGELSAFAAHWSLEQLLPPILLLTALSLWANDKENTP